MLDGTAYLSPVMSMSVAKPVTSKRSKRFADSFDEFDMMEKRQVNIENYLSRFKIGNFGPENDYFCHNIIFGVFRKSTLVPRSGLFLGALWVIL